jgi:hypothetical protein
MSTTLPDTSAYVSVRQHTSAYVSLRQHITEALPDALMSTTLPDEAVLRIPRPTVLYTYIYIYVEEERERERASERARKRE